MSQLSLRAGSYIYVFQKINSVRSNLKTVIHPLDKGYGLPYKPNIATVG